MRKPTDWLVAAHDIQCGTHSGIPPCCIAWYVIVWRHWTQERRDRYTTITHKVSGYAGYIPCPRCAGRAVSGLDTTIATIRACACDASLAEIEGMGLAGGAEHVLTHLERLAQQVELERASPGRSENPLKRGV